MSPRAKQYVEFINAYLEGCIHAGELHDLTEVHGVVFNEFDEPIDLEARDEIPEDLLIVTPYGGVKPEQAKAIERAKAVARSVIYPEVAR